MIDYRNTELGDGIMKGAGKGSMDYKDFPLFAYHGENYDVKGYFADKLDTNTIIHLIDDGAMIGHYDDRMVLIKAIDRPYAHLFYACPVVDSSEAKFNKLCHGSRKA